MIYQDERYPVHDIILHTTATRPEWMHGYTVAEKVAEIRRWHVEDRGWNDIGYHYVIDRDGSVGRGRTPETVGAGVKGKNRGVIHIAFVGGHGGSADDSFSDHYTSAQELAARALIRDLMGRTDIWRISGHNDWAAKACPCFRVIQDEWLPPPEKPQSALARLWGRVWPYLKHRG